MESRPSEKLLNEHSTYYEILGVAPDASIKVIKKACREILLEYHPDKGKATTNEEMTKLYLIKETLTDEKKRQEYDAKLNLHSSKKTVENSFKGKQGFFNETTEEKKHHNILIKQFRLIDEYLNVYLASIKNRIGHTTMLVQFRYWHESIHKEIQNLKNGLIGKFSTYNSTLEFFNEVKEFFQCSTELKDDTYRDYLEPCVEHCNNILIDINHLEELEKLVDKKGFLDKLKVDLLEFCNTYLKEKGEKGINEIIFKDKESIVYTSHRGETSDEKVKIGKRWFFDFQKSFEALPDGVQELIIVFREHDEDMRYQKEIIPMRISKTSKDMNIILSFDAVNKIVAKSINKSGIYTIFRQNITTEFYQSLDKKIHDVGSSKAQNEKSDYTSGPKQD